jgi:multicomponent Na+:H+ antiporter subunit E
MKHAVSLTFLVVVLWLGLSGLYKPVVLGLGVASCALVVYLALRMDVVDHEGHPIHLRPLQVLSYWAWLTREIVRSNVDVARRVLDPKLPIDPCVVTVECSQRTEFGQVVYANSITLTPGTVSMDVSGNRIRVHALTRKAAESLLTGEMDRRVAALEAGRDPAPR